MRCTDPLYTKLQKKKRGYRRNHHGEFDETDQANWQKDYCEAQDISMQEMEHGSTAGIFSLEPEEREAALEEFLKKEKKLYREMTAE